AGLLLQVDREVAPPADPGQAPRRRSFRLGAAGDLLVCRVEIFTRGAQSLLRGVGTPVQNLLERRDLAPDRRAAFDRCLAHPLVALQPEQVLQQLAAVAARIPEERVEPALRQPDRLAEALVADAQQALDLGVRVRHLVADRARLRSDRLFEHDPGALLASKRARDAEGSIADRELELDGQ